MRLLGRSLLIAIVAFAFSLIAAGQNNPLRERRDRAAKAFHDGVLLLHGSSTIDSSMDGFRQDPAFYYFTGLGNTVGAILAIDGRSGESWLFLPSPSPFLKLGLQPEVTPGSESEKRLAIEHVVDWSELNAFLSTRAAQNVPLYYGGDSRFAELPPNLVNAKSPNAPLWLQLILQKWPVFEVREAGKGMDALLEVQDSAELTSLRAAAKATVIALISGLRTIRPGVSQRSVETVVEDSCWKSGAHGSAFWPWVMAGGNGVFPTPFTSLARYDHLDRDMRAGELVRLDVGCEWDHYQGDLGRTVPVSGHYDDGQRETWTIFVAAYRSGVQALRAGVTTDQVFDAWRKQLLSYRDSARTPLAQHAIALWSDRKNLPYWQVHTSNVSAGYPSEPLKEGVTVNFEPIASVDGQGFFLEDMYLINKDGAELLTPGVPYSAEDIEAAMK